MATKEGSSEVNYLGGLGLGRLICIPMALRAAVDLKVFEIIAEAGEEAHLSSSQIASKLPTTNPTAPIVLDRILRILGASSLLSVKIVKNQNDGPVRAYGLTSETRSLVPNKEQVSAVPMLLLVSDEAVVKSFYGLKHAVLEEGCVPFDKLHGMNFFEYAGKEDRVNKVFNDAMGVSSSIAFDEVFKVYQGFNEVEELLDVGGGIGTSLCKIVCKYPQISGINFELSHVVADAPPYPGVKHVAGNMFDGIPETQNIMLKWVLHDWGDEYCAKILKNCWNALPKGGKVIVVEFVLPPVLGNNVETFNSLIPDLIMLNLNPGGKERTLVEYEDLAKAAGFSEIKPFPISQGLHVLEFLKN